MKSTYCSINWGKSAAIVMMVLVLALMVIALGTLNHTGALNAVGVDWGNRTMPGCDPKVKDCKVGVDWGSLTAPCPPTDPKCGLGPVAVDWGNAFSPEIDQEPPVDQVAVDWGNMMAPCLPTDPKCGLGPVAVDWGNSYSPYFKPPKP